MIPCPGACAAAGCSRCQKRTLLNSQPTSMKKKRQQGIRHEGEGRERVSAASGFGWGKHYYVTIDCLLLVVGLPADIVCS